MRRGKSDRKTKKKGTEDDEVEQMLRAAQDEILLNLSINSHLARASPSSTTLHPESDPGLDSVLDPDLERRFQALKMKNKVHQPVVEEHDLTARFDALKAKFNPPPVDPTVTSSKTQSHYEEEGESEEDEETQVQKLIEWAKDAARLDPSPPSPSQSESDDDDDDDDHPHHR